MKSFKYTITGKNEDLILTEIFGSENLKTVLGVVRKTEKFICSICKDFDLYNLYLKNVYYIVITDNNTNNVVYNRKLSDIIDSSNEINLLTDSLIQKFKFIEESPHYYVYMLKVLNTKCFLELRCFNIDLNKICLKIEKILNNYIAQNEQKAA